MKILSVVLLTVWLIIFGAINATWITMSTHNFGILTIIVGLAILLLELYFTGVERKWFGPRA
jgi:putative effector of murein hydrolase LrgA (UPF0299 family)